MDDLTSLPNIGETLAEKLRGIGIHTYEELAGMGSIEAIMRMGQPDRRACYNMLYALEGAIQGVRWHNLPKGERAQLKREFDRNWGENG